MKRILLSAFAALLCTVLAAQPQLRSQWDVYWHLLEDILGIKPYVYGISGHRMNQIIGQGERLEREHGQDVDAIIVFVGTNDFNGSIPMGEWYSYSYEQTVAANRQTGRQEVFRRHRELIYDDATFKGRANTTLRWLKTHYPDKQIIFLTPIHRAFAQFSDDNIQPPESFANACGLFIDDYVQAVQELANVWAVPVIDLNSISGLYPLLDEHAHYFRNADTDRLHPNTPGHVRMAWALAYQLLGYPAAFPNHTN